MKLLFKKWQILLIALLLQACTAPNNQTTGTVLGGAAGGLIGSQFGRGKGKVAAAAAGALIGAVGGGQVAREMENR